MKELFKSLAITTAVSLVAVPCTIIGMCIGGTLWNERIEPWAEKKFKKQKLTRKES